MELKDKIVHVSYELFGSKGYEKTTITDIVKAANTSKGGFYHHFSSKNDILEAILDNYYKDLESFYENQFKDSKDPIDIFNGIFDSVNDYKRSLFGRWPEIIKVFSFEGNVIINMKSAVIFEKMTGDFYTKVIELGINEGIFKTDNPKFVGELWAREILKVYTKINYLIYEYTEERYKEFVDLLDFQENLIYNLLGIKEGITLKNKALSYYQEASETYKQLKAAV